MNRRRWWPLAVRSLASAIVCGVLLSGAWAAEEDGLPPQSVGSLLSRRSREAVSSASPAPSPAARQTAAAPKPAGGKGVEGGKGIRLFGTLELRSKIGNMPKWTAVLEKERAHPGFVGDRVFPGMGPWKAIREKFLKLPSYEQLKAVNALINRWPYRTDMDVWGVMDYWAAPVDFFKKSGDCEDFAIAKYFALRNLGFPASQMRLVVLKDTLRNLDHAVVVVYLDGEAWVLDNLSNAVLSHRRLSHYKPQLSLNEESRWAHLKPGGSGSGKGQRARR